MHADRDDLALALEMADRADELTLASFTGEAVDFTHKADGSPVTETDAVVERTLLELVTRVRPHDGFLGEETGLSNDGPRLWIVDPIDGTRSFVEGGKAWGTLVALSDKGRLSIGVATAPAVGARWWAAMHVGAWVRRAGAVPHELVATDTRALDAARWVCHPSIDALNPVRTERVRPLLERCGPPIVATTHGALMVAEGIADICVQLSGGPWDFAAPAVIVEAAGGAFSYIDGSRELRPTGAAVFSNGVLHPALLAAIAL